MSVKFNPEQDIPDLHGKTVVVTGGNSGLGAASVRAIAAHNPSQLFLCARTPSKATDFITEVRKQHPEAKITPIQLDLASLASVKKGAEEINKAADKIDILMLNAGVSGLSAGLTEDGYEVQFGTNHVGHALLAQLLMPKVLKAKQAPDADVRIITVSSVATFMFKVPSTGVDFDLVKTDMVDWRTTSRYGQSKLANVLFAQKLAELYPSISSTAPHPGTVFTGIWGKGTGIPSWLGSALGSAVWAFGLTADQGALNQLWCAFGKGVQNGKYYDPVGIAGRTSKHVESQKLRDDLWEWTNAEIAKHGGTGWPKA